MIFEKQQYQQDCINNIITLLKDFDFNIHNAENLKNCLNKFYTTHTIPLKNLSNKLNLDILMETGTGKTFTYLNLIFELHNNFKQNKFIIFVPRKAILESVKQNIKLTEDYFFAQYEKHLKFYTYSDTKSQSDIINHYIKNTDELSVLILTNSAINKESNILNKNKESLVNTESIFTNIANLKPISIIDEPHLLKGEAFNKYFSQINSLYFRFGATFPKDPKDREYELSNVVYCLDSISAFNHYLVKQIRTHTIVQDSDSLYLIQSDSKMKNATFSYFTNGIERQRRINLNQDLGELDPRLRGSCIAKITKDKVYLDNGEVIQTKKSSYVLQENEITLLLQKAIDLHFEKEMALFQKGIKTLSLFFIPSVDDFRGEKPFIKNEFERIYKQKREKILKQDLPQDYRDYLKKDFDKENTLRVHQGYFSGDSLRINKKKETGENLEASDIKMILEEKEKILSFETPLRFIFSVWALQEGWDNPNIFTLTKLANSSSDTSRHQQVGRGLRLCVNNEGKRITHSFVNYNDSEFFDINYLDMVISSKERGFIEGLQKEIEDSSFSLSNNILSSDFLKHLNLNERQINRIFIELEDLGCLEFDKDNNCYKIIAPLDEVIQADKFKELLGEHYTQILEAFKPRENKHEYVVNANKTNEKVKIKQNLAKEFKELWQSINKQARIVYENIKEADLIESVVKSFNAINISQENILYEKKIYDSKRNKIIVEKTENITTKDHSRTLHKNLPYLFIEFARANQKHINEELPLHFLLKIYNHSEFDKQSFSNSPKVAFQVLQDCIKKELHKNLLQSVDYDFSQNTFSNERFQILYNEDGTPKQSIEKHKLGKYIARHDGQDCIPSKYYLYDKAVCDSKIEEIISLEENSHLRDNNSTLDHEIEVFAKLPKLSIPTPYKNYEPDFAYLLKNKKGQKIFFVCESKGYNQESEISEQERKKIDYARVFFEKLGESLQNKNIKVLFNTRINRQNLLQVLQEVMQKMTQIKRRESNNDR